MSSPIDRPRRAASKRHRRALYWQHDDRARGARSRHVFSELCRRTSSVSEPLSSERCQIHFHGRVQGVGFRYTTREIASQYAVTGFVRNQPDGSVLLVAEGKPDELERFVRDLQQRMERNIRSSEKRQSRATGEFADFTIRQ